MLQAKTNFDFLSKRYIAGVFSLILIGLSAYIWVARGTEKYGIDFIGGFEVLVEIQKDVSAGDIAKSLEASPVQGASVQSFEVGSHQFSIRIPAKEEVALKQVVTDITTTLKASFGDEVKVLKSDSVGATIGEEIRERALWAVALGIIGILTYIAIRFEFSYGLGAVVAVFHDVIIATGAYLWAGHELNGSTLAAALTILGYSVNDTIVIFDRVREEARKRKNTPLAEILNEAMNLCLSRTIITSGLTFLAAISLLVLGGGAIQDLSLYLVVGLIIGSYSTIYIAAPVVLWWENRRAAKAK